VGHDQDGRQAGVTAENFLARECNLGDVFGNCKRRCLRPERAHSAPAAVFVRRS
jgi:hypothetical protein